jgi:3-phenylpropionate/trans-cinnamate dioxygenase ferredoxin component
MSEMVDAASAGDIREGVMKAVAVKGKELLLARVDGKYFAADNTCPHLKGRLSEGKLDGFTITCPRHGSQFDIRNGEVVRWMKGSGIVYNLGKMLKTPHALAVYRVEIRKNRVMVEI